MSQRYDVCVIGGGAAGLAAAACLNESLSTCILEKNRIPGRKLLATGGGRCNLTNAACEGAQETLDFFASLGLETVSDSEGRYFPYSGCASDVAKTLTDAARAKGCEILTGCPVISAGKEGDIFVVRAENLAEEVRARALILACGGKAAPQYGTTGDGYRIARAFGHHVSRLYPILAGIECGDFPDLKGIRAKGRVRLLKDGSEIAAEEGEIQFTEDGLSGICVFNMTPMIRTEETETPAEAFARYTLSVDLAPDFTPEQIAARTSTFGILNERLSARIGKDEIKCWRLPVRGVKGWKKAQCTAGGVVLEEIDPLTMQSRLTEGLYFAGEILDVQGPCGGYNLQNAWETGRRAAAAVNNQLQGRTEDGR